MNSENISQNKKEDSIKSELNAILDNIKINISLKKKNI